MDDAKSVLGLGLFLLIVIGIPLSCESRGAHERRETEAICRRAIERNYSVTAEQAVKVIEAQRAWEGR